jgi:cell division protein FtsN
MNTSGFNMVPTDTKVQREKPASADKTIKENTTQQFKHIPDLPVEPTGPLYYVIAGSYSTMTNAYNRRTELRKKNFKSEIIISADHKIRVTYAGFTESADALLFLEEMKEKENQAAWLLKQ